MPDSPAGGAEYKEQIFLHRSVGEQVKVLKDNAQLAAQQVNILSGQPTQVETGDFTRTVFERQRTVEGF